MEAMDIHDLQVKNRSYRRFYQDPVPENVIDYALENARIANCSVNSQHLRYIAVLSKEKVEKMQPLVKWAAFLPPEIGSPKANEQPTAFIVITENRSSDSIQVDLGIAIHSITISLIEKGYGSCIMGNIKRKEIAALLNIPEEEKIGLLIAVGKPRCTSTIVDAKKGDSLKYYVEDSRNYYVPKLAFNEVVRKI